MCVCVYLCICLFVFVQSLYAMHCTEVDRVGQDAPSGLFVPTGQPDRSSWTVAASGSRKSGILKAKRFAESAEEMAC